MTSPLATTLALAACSAVLAACGGDDEGEPIPQGVAESMQQQLDNIRGQIDNGSLGACEDILAGEDDATFATLERIAQEVPQRVDSDVREALDQSISRLRELVEQECDRLADEEEQQRPEEEPVEPEPVPEETVPEEEPPPTETVPPDDGGQGQDGETPAPPGQGGTPPGQGGTPPGQGDGGDSGGIVVPEGDG
jgi:hypothetical protein